MDEVPLHECRDVLDTFPGIWFVTIPNGELILEASQNYHDRWSGGYRKLEPVKLPNGSLVHWLIPRR